jgi:hypothetical protein
MRKGNVMKASQKLRLVINGIHFHTTAKKIRAGIGDEYRGNAAAQKCLLVLENMREVEKFPPVGLAGHWEGYNVQLDMI